MQTFENSELELVVNGYEGRAIRKLEDGQLLIRVCCFQLDGQARALVWSLHRGLVDHWALDNTIVFVCKPFACTTSLVQANFDLSEKQSVRTATVFSTVAKIQYEQTADAW